MTDPPSKILIIGLGNPVLGDDGVGWHVADQVQSQLITSRGSIHSIEISKLSLGGLSLMEQIIGYKRVIIIDSINIAQAALGEVFCFPLEDMPNLVGGHLSSSHDTSFQTALQIGRSLDADLPEEIFIIGIQSPYVYDFSETLSSEVANAVPRAADTVLHLLNHKTCPEHLED